MLSKNISPGCGVRAIFSTWHLLFLTVISVKDKTKILMELDELREVRDELTEEVTSLTSELEKERSKVHQLQGEINKQKVREICEFQWQDQVLLMKK